LPLIEERFGAITLLPLFAKAQGPATRIILQARKGSREGLKLLPGLVLHEEDGRYTEKAEAVLREGQSLQLGG
jgi:tRNA1(Val) A37 N6-methylase TrmN6